MAKINLLDKSVFELIAAGEVIERPASVIKELVENSIDAGAKHITIEIKNGGTSFMRITDDGCGIAFEELPTAFLRHATSKVRNADDLDRIFTLGFRGEALASVAAVSRVEVLSKETGSEMGGNFRIDGGEVIEHERIGCPDGTTIIVRDLFYNVPARQKFLRKDITEGNQIQSLADKLALAHPEIAFRFIRDNKVVRDTSGAGDYYYAIYSVFGKQFAMSLIPVDFSLNGISVTGYVSSPLFSRGNRTLQYFYVNGRCVKSVICMTALEEGFRNSIMVGKFPACVLNLTMPPELCDVNVSPSKTEVRFASDKSVFDVIDFGVRNAVINADSRREVKLVKKEIPTVPADTRSAERILLDKAVSAVERAPVSGEAPASEPPKISEPVIAAAENVKRTSEPFVKKYDVPYEQQRFSARVNVIAPGEDEEDSENDCVPAVVKDEQVLSRESGKGFRYINSGSFEEKPCRREDVSPEISSEPEKSPLKVIGEAFGTYIVCTCGDEMLMIDKHAAHERINFEKRRMQLITSSQILAESITVYLTAGQYGAIAENTELLAEAGIDVVLSDGGKCEITAAPTAFTGDGIKIDPADMVVRAANALEAGSTNIIDEIYGDFQHTRACKAAIKAHDITPRAELESLAREVWENGNIRFCPHGRPIILRLTEHELEKYFSRIQ
ncbi:MAG: DNA mismatch repair endonuclease MutL [Ruminiclostridium sp.]|nr:DNA mismatch repair endonuclease MutL [Ruminiclostridium sp.]